MFPRILSASIVATLVFQSHAADVAGGGGKTGELKLAPRMSAPFLAPADANAETWRKNIRVPEGFQIETWAERADARQSRRVHLRRAGALLHRARRTATAPASSISGTTCSCSRTTSRCGSVEDRIAFTKRNFPKDWQELEKETRSHPPHRGHERRRQGRPVARLCRRLQHDARRHRVRRARARRQLWFTNIPDLWRSTASARRTRGEAHEPAAAATACASATPATISTGSRSGRMDGSIFPSATAARDRGQRKGKVLIDLPDEGAVFRCEPDGSASGTRHARPAQSAGTRLRRLRQSLHRRQRQRPGRPRALRVCRRRRRRRLARRLAASSARQGITTRGSRRKCGSRGRRGTPAGHPLADHEHPRRPERRRLLSRHRSAGGVRGRVLRLRIQGQHGEERR